MKVLYIGDIMAEPGRRVVKKLLPEIKAKNNYDLVIAQVENSNNHGKGPGIQEIEELIASGVDVFTGGNHSLEGKNSTELFQSQKFPLLRPENLVGAPGKGWLKRKVNGKDFLVVSLLGQTVGKQQLETDNPLKAIDKVLSEQNINNDSLVIVNFHGDFSSEKRVIGYYLDGRAAAVIGDHWHVASADAGILPKGTAHISDVGMCGTLHSSLGVKTDVIIARWRNGHGQGNIIETEGPLIFSAVSLEINEKTGLSDSIELIQKVVE